MMRASVARCAVAGLLALAALAALAALRPVRRAAANPPSLEVVATAPVLEVLDPNGVLDAATVQDAIARRSRALGRCGSDARWTGDALAWIVLDWHGKVTQLELAVGKPAVEACLAGELRKLVIAGAQGRTTIVARLHLAPALVSNRPPEPAPVKRGEVRATRVAPGPRFAEPDRVRDALIRQLQDATVCYEQALETRPRLAGAAALELAVATTGAIDAVTVGSAPGAMADCLKRAMLRVRLPAPGAADTVRVELQLGPLPEPAPAPPR